MSLRAKVSLIVILAIALGVFVTPGSFNFVIDKINVLTRLEGKSYAIPNIPDSVPFRLGLDLQGGVHLVYQADLTNIGFQDASEAMNGVRDVIERRVNRFGVAEPVVQIEGKDRLIVELAGVADIREAIRVIGLTPFLEFREERSLDETREIITAQENEERLDEDPFYIPTGLTGQHLKRSAISFDPLTQRPGVSLELTDVGADLFAELTKRNIGKTIAIYLDGFPVSDPPTVNEEITSGDAIITGNFTLDEAQEYVTRLNSGALPVPITRISQQSVDATLGSESLSKSLRAGIYGLIAVAIFMIFFYRLPGILAVVALFIYVLLVMALYKLLGVTLTLAGIAGFILSLGMAVDANILIFARMKEELETDRKLSQAMYNGFSRAWFSIRDGHITTLLGAVILFLFATSIVKGFALTLAIGVIVSLFTALFVTRAFMELFTGVRYENKRWLFK